MYLAYLTIKEMLTLDPVIGFRFGFNRLLFKVIWQLWSKTQ